MPAEPVSKVTAEENGQGLSPAPTQNKHPENGSSNSFSVRESDNQRHRRLDSLGRTNEIEVKNDVAAMDNDRNDGGLLPDDFNCPKIGELNHDQNTNTNINPGGNPCDSRPGYNPGASNRTDDEVKNGIHGIRNSSDYGINNRRADWSLGRQEAGNHEEQSEKEIAPSARLASRANQANFDAGKITLPHVQNEPSADQSATCGKPEPNTAKQSTSQSREVIAFNPSIFTVDVITASKNRWKIRIRCRKQNCEHSDHLKIKTVSLISDSVYKKLIRSKKRNYELWKKQILVENAPALRKGE